MVNKSLSIIATVILALLSVGQNVLAQESFFKGKNIRIVVASTAGGGFDAYTRMLSRYLGKYIPGNPSIVVENMPGAGHLIGANHIYKVAKPDGLTIGHFQGGYSSINSWRVPASNSTHENLNSSALQSRITAPVLSLRQAASQA